ncbi:cysteine hydrolase family protein [Sciscionella sediminilitoris]|uniref:cysteine hydrolase family protein n=1 Tax=Sciscionella sediminilitoris TaxID=1445613 RepID=UPI0004DF4C0F|nr:cysteine hydrolase family protein [Sciscionella sp. SE31]
MTEPVAALLLVDLQRGFVTGDSAVPAAVPLLRTVSALLERARASGAFVVQLQNDGPEGELDEPGTPGWQPYFPPAEGEPVVRKTADDGFYETELGELLRAKEIRRLAVCGVLSEMCVRATAEEALDRGYGVVLPHDAHATYDIPPAPGDTDPVPAAMAARTAEWSLGDQVEILAAAGQVRFTRPR